ncbi:MAG: hypothetical protein KF778_05415 [Rhodocyclaceae bacterium]|nr:hypothetical protein [Rhodocyclaceae bacterium]MBX3667821.1 hypothetical protein [Rhodocyclaceae bacterium]
MPIPAPLKPLPPARPVAALRYAALALPAFLAGLWGWASGRVAPQAAAHIAFAAGILPLILAAQQYFVPVLARCGPPTPALRLLPALALLAGAGIGAAFLWPAALPWAQILMPALALLAALLQLGWTVACARRALGGAHAGLAWYVAALACLCLALAAAALMPWWPAARAALRLLHLHLNLLGFVGLTALGTLAVLLPTALRLPDAQAALRLRADLWPAAGGVLAIAAGAAWWHSLALLGTLALAWPLLRLGRAWCHAAGWQALRAHGNAIGLAAGACGFFALLLLGIAHGQGLMSGRTEVQAFVPAVLLPLVTGSVGELAPVWLRPGPQGECALQVRALLARGAPARAAAFLAAGTLAACGWPAALWLALPALLQFGLQCVRVAALHGTSRPQGPAL